MRNVSAASGCRWGRIGVAAVAAAGLLAFGAAADAQVTRAGGLIRHDRGQSVSPVYEGWYQRPDGAIVASFGYFNRNHVEEVSIPVGPNNRVAPGPEDQGQPTYFYPRRRIGVFTIVLPADTDAEVTWTLTSRGETLEIPVNLDAEYLIEPFKAAAGPSPGNAPPVVRFDPGDEGFSGPAGGLAERTVATGASLPLDVVGQRRRFGLGPRRAGADGSVEQVPGAGRGQLRGGEPGRRSRGRSGRRGRAGEHCRDAGRAGRLHALRGRFGRIAAEQPVLLDERLRARAGRRRGRSGLSRVPRPAPPEAADSWMAVSAAGGRSAFSGTGRTAVDRIR